MAHTAAQAESACEVAVGIWNRLAARAAEINAGQERLFHQLSPTRRGGKNQFDPTSRL
jgi:hypothetical protein